MKNGRIKRVYKYRSAEHGISNLTEKRLKVSTTADLNDPFDLCPLDTTNPDIERATRAICQHFNDKRGILCFSRNWDNLLLWSHYAASHTGVCLGFEVFEDGSTGNLDTDVLYQPSPLKISCPEDVDFDLANRMLRTKYESWSYEQEVRMFVGLEDPPDANGIHWISFDAHLVLKEVIVGARCSPADNQAIKAAVESYGGNVKCWWAAMRADAFSLVRLDHAPAWLE